MKLRKIMIVGVGHVGCTAAYNFIVRSFCDEIVLADLDKDRLEANAKDLRDAAAFLPNVPKISIRNSTECKDIDIAIITVTAGIVQGRDRKEELVGSAKIIHNIVPGMMENGFDGIFLVATNPCDAIVYQVWKLSNLPRHRVIGTGVWLDTIRLRGLLAEKLLIGPQSIDAYILGEHGNSQFPVWSHASIYGSPLNDFSNIANELDVIAQKTCKRAFEIIPHKGCTEYAIGSVIVDICFNIFTNSHRIIALSCVLDGQYDYRDVAIGVPAIINQEGIKEIIQINFSQQEQQLFTNSVDIIKGYIHIIRSASLMNHN